MKTQLITDKPVHLDITLKPGVWIDPSKFIKQIADAGYAARKEDIRLTLIGKVIKEGDKLLFMVEDIKPDTLKFLIKQGISKNEKEVKARAEAFEKVGAKVGETIELEAFWNPADTKRDKEALPTLSVIRCNTVKHEDEAKQ